jgi:uncharacterized protein
MEDVFILDYECEAYKKLIYAPLQNYIERFEEDDDYQSHVDKIKTMAKRRVCNYENRYPTLSLALTENCNLRCRYCYANGGSEHKNKSIDHDVLTSVLDHYYEGLRVRKVKKAFIAFNGGCEPTCAFDLLQYAVGYSNALAGENQIEVIYSMATNGCYGHEIRNFIIDHFENISLSFDGPKEIQNYQRPLVSGRESYDTVFETAKAFYDSSLNLDIHVVVTDYSLCALDRVLKFFEKELSGVKVTLTKMDPVDGAKGVVPPNEQDFIRAVKTLREGTYDLKWHTADGFYFKHLRSKYCDSIASPNWFVSVEGRVNACMRDVHMDKPQFDIGSFNCDDKKIDFDEVNIKRLKTYNIYEQVECRTCFARYLCGGGCPYLREVGGVRCDLIKSEAKAFIREQYERQSHKRLFETLFSGLVD